MLALLTKANLEYLGSKTYGRRSDAPNSVKLPLVIQPRRKQSPKCLNSNEPLDKQAAVLILTELLKGK